MTPAGLLSILPIVGVLTGFARARYPRVPWLAAGAITIVYLLGLTVTGGWAAACWDCAGSTDTSRSEIFYVTAIYFGIIVGATLLGIWLGSRTIVVAQRLFRTIGELRGRN